MRHQCVGVCYVVGIIYFFFTGLLCLVYVLCCVSVCMKNSVFSFVPRLLQSFFPRCSFSICFLFSWLFASFFFFTSRCWAGSIQYLLRICIATYHFRHIHGFLLPFLSFFLFHSCFAFTIIYCRLFVVGECVLSFLSFDIIISYIASAVWLFGCLLVVSSVV